MKKICARCGRLVGVQKDGTLARHREKTGGKNRKKTTRSPYCKGRAEPDS
jgi:hypothetical protein